MIRLTEVDENPNGKKVLLAFSGGTDSCYAAVKLSRAGHRVEALVLDMTGDREFIHATRDKAAHLGIPCHAIDVREEFRNGVVDYFTGEYLRGRTPAPCTVCNPLIKWKYLHRYAASNGFDRIATGHYFRITESGGYLHVTRAADSVKDQSYYLWMLPQEVLAMALTPMGDEIKAEVVSRGAAPVQRESMGVCFLKGGDYRGFLRAQAPGHLSCRPGEVTDRAGNPVGRHDGCAFYTPGQKKGLSLPAGWAVTGIDAARNRVIAGPGGELFASRLVLENFIITGNRLHGNFIPEIKIRGVGRNPCGGASYTVEGSGHTGGCIGSCGTENPDKSKRNGGASDSGKGDNRLDGGGTEGSRLILHLAEPAWAPAPGQPVVFYDGDLVIGGGWLAGYS
ncbi:MAG: tRNA-specific 2-thiouridylase [Alistipes sp.]|nr:tRNA-specific 2-thiouridylase [Alistipes sp.]